MNLFSYVKQRTASLTTSHSDRMNGTRTSSTVTYAPSIPAQMAAAILFGIDDSQRDAKIQSKPEQTISWQAEVRVACRLSHSYKR